MKYLRSKLATEWPDKESGGGGGLKFLSKLIPDANPKYKLHLVQEWLIEFDDGGLPDREIGLGADGSPVLVGPDDQNYGFWLDTNMTYNDFNGTDVDKDIFEQAWREWHNNEQSAST